MCTQHLVCHVKAKIVLIDSVCIMLLHVVSYLVLWTLLFFNFSLYNIGLFLHFSNSIVLLRIVVSFLFFGLINVSFFVSLQWWRTASSDERDSAKSFSAALLVTWIWISLCHSAPQICHSTLEWSAVCNLCVSLSTGVCMEGCMGDF